MVSLRITTPDNHDGPALLTPPEPALEARPRKKEEGHLHCSGEVRILVLDDDEAVCRVIQAALGNHDFIVDVVADPVKVEAALKGQTYHVIIMDYVIPGLQAEQILTWVREHQSSANIIVVTGAQPFGVDIGFRTHARTGIPVTLATLVVAIVWLWVRSLAG